MEHQKTAVWLSGFLALTAMGLGCGSTHRIESARVPDQPMANEKAPPAQEVLAPSGHYSVKKHDCLWTIAEKPGIYGDPFQWPLLFKANRDEIKDPDLIFPRQNLVVEKSFSMEERTHARQMAMATPKYVRHSKPRETLPVDYF